MPTFARYDPELNVPSSFCREASQANALSSDRCAAGVIQRLARIDFAGSGPRCGG